MNVKVVSEGQRIWDGFTVVKLLLSISMTVIALFISIVGWVYITDRSEMKTAIIKMANDVGDIKSQSIRAYDQINTNAKMIDKNTRHIEEFRKEVRQYWNSKDYRGG